MACTGAAAVLSDVLPLQRSYWVPLTVAIVLKPDYGSVFAAGAAAGHRDRGGRGRRGGAAGAGARGPWLLIPFAVLAALAALRPQAGTTGCSRRS